MPHPDARRPIAYEFMEGSRDILVVLNDRDAPAPRYMIVDGRPVCRNNGARRFRTDWKPTPGETYRFVDADEAWAVSRAEAMADWMWGEDGGADSTIRANHPTREDLAAVLLQGLLKEVELGAPMIVLIEEEAPSGGQDGSDRAVPAGGVRVPDPDTDPGF